MKSRVCAQKVWFLMRSHPMYVAIRGHGGSLGTVMTVKLGGLARQKGLMITLITAEIPQDSLIRSMECAEGADGDSGAAARGTTIRSVKDL
jgi:hypothetical protein